MQPIMSLKIGNYWFRSRMVIQRVLCEEKYRRLSLYEWRRSWFWTCNHLKKLLIQIWLQWFEWMRERMQDSPIIGEIRKRSASIRKVPPKLSASAHKRNYYSNSVRNKIENVREFWVTSQSPIIYRLSEAWDIISSQTEESHAVSAFLKLDPKFILLFC